jgi:hypothetical protein
MLIFNTGIGRNYLFKKFFGFRAAKSRIFLNVPMPPSKIMYRNGQCINFSFALPVEAEIAGTA